MCLIRIIPRGESTRLGFDLHSPRRAAWTWMGALLVSLCADPALAAESSVWNEGDGLRWRAMPELRDGRDGFSRIAASRTGIQFTNTLGEQAGAANRVLYNGAGVAAGDFDGDGRTDLFFCSLSGSNALFRNRGEWRFENVTASAGLAARLPETRGATFADVDGDGRLDLLLSVNGRGVKYFHNEGSGRFSDRTELAGTASGRGSTSMALADVDGNGTLDLYVANYRPDDIRDRGRVQLRVVNGRPFLPGSETNRFVMLDGKLEECGQPDQLFLGDGQGRFREVSWTGGRFVDEKGVPLTEAPNDWGLSASFRDVDGDGAPDLYVCNDYWTPDRFWLGDGKGNFRAVPSLALRKTPASSMSVDFADIDRDGNLDLFVVDMLSRDPRLRKRQWTAPFPRPTESATGVDRLQVPRNVLGLNRGDGTFAEVAYQAGVEATDWSWSAVFLDVDLDGYEDLLVGAGHFRDVQDMDAERQIQARQKKWAGVGGESERQRAFTRELMEHYRLYPNLRMPIGGFRNLRGVRFEERTRDWGLDVPGVHQGIALADLDDDGALDLAVNGLDAEAMVFRNESAKPRVAVRLLGQAPNRAAIGARVTFQAPGLRDQTWEAVCGGRYLSGSDPLAVFAVGTNAGPMSLEVRWRDGQRRRIADVVAGRLYEVRQQAATDLATNRPPSLVDAAQEPWFEDVTARLGSHHAETAFDDRARQPLLPWALGETGPGLAWFDLDRDGDDDLVVGGSRGNALGVFFTDPKGVFRGVAGSGSRLEDDAAGIVGWSRENGVGGLLVAQTGYETPVTHGLTEWKWDGTTLSSLGAGVGISGGSALALGDPAGDGRWVLFVGGGVVPGAYPRAAASRLFRWVAGAWRPDVRNGVLLENLGIVQGATWSDLDADGVPELVLACEWGPVRVFQWRGDRLVEETRALGLEEFRGWWRGVATGDLNEDGRLDLVVSNWGRNSPYRASSEQPLVFAYGELAQPGVVEVIETEYVEGKLSPRLSLGTLATSMPFLAERFPRVKDYSTATLDGVLGDRTPLARRVSVTTLESTVFLSDGGRYRAVALPAVAQQAPAFGVAISDFDGDGHEDVMLAQNFFPVQAEIGRLDSGLCLWLRGDGRGGFEPVSAAASGVRVYGQQRGLAVADFDGDGRMDFAVAQNGAETKLYRNRRARPGVRLRVEGGGPNKPD